MTLNDINPQAKIGKDVTIGNFTTICEDVEIGDGCWIGPNVTIFPGARIGKNCKVFPGAVISAVPQDLKFAGEYSTVEIGDNNVIRECCTINRGTAASGKTVVGDDNLIMAYVHIAHDCVVGNNCVFANNATLAGHITVGDYTILGGKTAILQFVHIGSHVITAGGALVDKDIPPFVKAARYPISYAGVNTIGLKRRPLPERPHSEPRGGSHQGTVWKYRRGEGDTQLYRRSKHGPDEGLLIYATGGEINVRLSDCLSG